MSPEPGPGPARPEPRWTLVQRGAFAHGRCDVCGFASPGRRARSSVESDLATHEVLCQASEQYVPEVAGAAADAVTPAGPGANRGADPADEP
jgi:hypothetical protein